ITFKIVGGENLNFAIPVNYLRGLADSPVSALSLTDLRTKLASELDVFKSDVFPTRWKSLSSGTIKIIRRDGDRLYIETVLPEAERKAGCFSLAELEKQGEVYVGIGKFSCVCQYIPALEFSYRTNRFSSDAAIAITKLTPTRIEGQAPVPPNGIKIDCKN